VVDVATGVESGVQIQPTHDILAGAFRNDGSILGVVQDGRGKVRAYEVSVEQPARPLSPPVPAGVFEFSVAGDMVLAASCDGRGRSYSLDLRHPTNWRPVRAFCNATLSPDGRTVASSPDGRTVVTSSLDGRGGPERALELAELEGLPLGVVEDPQIVGKLAWGDGGLAAIVAGRTRLAVVTVAPDGSVATVGIGESSAGYGFAAAWVPEGAELAIANSTHTESIVRSLDVPAGRGSVLGLIDEPIRDLVWSPSSDVLLAATPFSWVFVDPEGGWLQKVPVSRSRGTPVAWAI